MSISPLEHTPNATVEYFTGPHTLENITNQYDLLTEAMIMGDHAQVDRITTNHQEALTEELGAPGSHDNIWGTLGKAEHDLREAFSKTHENVHDFMTTTAAILNPLLSAEDRQVLEETRTAVRARDTEGFRSILERASDDRARRAIQVSVDRTVLEQLPELIENAAQDPDSVNRILELASSPTAEAALRAAMDGEVLAKLITTAKRGGLNDALKPLLRLASEELSVRPAMRAALDATVLNVAKNTLVTSGQNLEKFDAVLAFASSGEAEAVIEGTAHPVGREGAVPRYARVRAERQDPLADTADAEVAPNAVAGGGLHRWFRRGRRSRANRS